jgi:hypothetical protein
MKTIDQIRINAPIGRVFEAASNVERWPSILGHYRWVHVLEQAGNGARRRAAGQLVEMAAWRPFGLFNYPTWWVSEMTVHPDVREVRYRHVRGITRGMDVVWRLQTVESLVEVEIEHLWRGPNWPLIGPLAAELVIGPVFIHGIASRTLAGIKKYVEGSQ